LRPQDVAFDGLDESAESRVVFDHPSDLSLGVEDGGMVASAEEDADFFEAPVRQPTREEHADLARDGDGLGPLAALEIAEAGTIAPDDGIRDFLDGDGAGGGGDEVAEGLLGEGEIDLTIAEGGMAEDADDGAFEFAVVGVDDAGDVLDDVLREVASAEACFLLDDGDACFETRAVDADDEAPLES
jgi:hypothetical protein